MKIYKYEELPKGDSVSLKLNYGLKPYYNDTNRYQHIGVRTVKNKDGKTIRFAEFIVHSNMGVLYATFDMMSKWKKVDEDNWRIKIIDEDGIIRSLTADIDAVQCVYCPLMRDTHFNATNDEMVEFLISEKLIRVVDRTPDPIFG